MKRLHIHISVDNLEKSRAFCANGHWSAGGC